MCLCRPDTSLVPEVFLRSSQTKLSYEARAKSPKEARSKRARERRRRACETLERNPKEPTCRLYGALQCKMHPRRPKADGRGGRNIKRAKSVRARVYKTPVLSLAPISPVLSAHPDYLPLGLRERVKWRL